MERRAAQGVPLGEQPEAAFGLPLVISFIWMEPLTVVGSTLLEGPRAEVVAAAASGLKLDDSADMVILVLLGGTATGHQEVVDQEAVLPSTYPLRISLLGGTTWLEGCRVTVAGTCQSTVEDPAPFT